MRQDEMRAIGEPRAMAASVKKKALPGRLECVSKGNGPRDVEEAAGTNIVGRPPHSTGPAGGPITQTLGTNIHLPVVSLCLG